MMFSFFSRRGAVTLMGAGRRQLTSSSIAKSVIVSVHDFSRAGPGFVDVHQRHEVGRRALLWTRLCLARAQGAWSWGAPSDLLNDMANSSLSASNRETRTSTEERPDIARPSRSRLS